MWYVCGNNLQMTEGDYGVALIDQDKTIITIQAKIYRAKAPGVFHGNNAEVIKIIDSL